MPDIAPRKIIGAVKDEWPLYRCAEACFFPVPSMLTQTNAEQLSTRRLRDWRVYWVWLVVRGAPRQVLPIERLAEAGSPPLCRQDNRCRQAVVGWRYRPLTEVRSNAFTCSNGTDGDCPGQRNTAHGAQQAPERPARPWRMDRRQQALHRCSLYDAW